MSEHRRIIYALIIYAWLLEKAILKKSTVNQMPRGIGSGSAESNQPTVGNGETYVPFSRPFPSPGKLWNKKLTLQYWTVLVPVHTNTTASRYTMEAL